MSELEPGYRLNRQAAEFFLYEYFGIVAKDYTENIKEDSRKTKIIKCVRRAYLDMNRTLVLNKNAGSFYDEIGNDLAAALANSKPIAELRKDAYCVFFDCKGNLKESIGKLLVPKTIKNPNK